MDDIKTYQAVVPGNVIDHLRDLLADDSAPVRCYYGMAVTLGKTDYSIAEAVELLRAYEADGIYSPEAAVIASPLTPQEAYAACVRIYHSDEYARKRSERLSKKAGKPITWTPAIVTDEDIAYCHDIQDKAGAGYMPEQTSICATDSVLPVGGGWHFPGRLESYNYITDDELTQEELDRICRYVYDMDIDGGLPF